MVTATKHICPSCSHPLKDGDQETIPYALSHGSRLKEIRFCRNCELGSAFPQLTESELTKLYDDGEYWQNANVRIFSPRINPGHFASAVYRWDLIQSTIDARSIKRLKILDIGAGYGYMGSAAILHEKLDVAKYHVIEPDRVFQESLKKTWSKCFAGVDFKLLKDIKEGRDKYDLIILSHVLEHVTDPNEILKNIRSHLSEEGHIFVDIPHQDHLYKNDVFPHLLFFTRESLKLLLEHNDYQVNYINCFGKKRERSPMNVSNSSKVEQFFEKILYKSRRIMPRMILNISYNMFFGLNHMNDNGTWLRAIAQKNKIRS